MQLIDIGINLAHDSYDADRDAVIARAVTAGVSQMVITGASLAGTSKAIDLTFGAPERLVATAGVHPHHAIELTASTYSQLATLAKSPAVAAVGECGLDYFRDYSPRSAQHHAFEQQLALAAEIGKPVFLHLRDARDDFFAILAPWRPRIVAAVAHCFTDDLATVRLCLDHDLHIGMTGWFCDERRGQHLSEVVRAIPAGRLMLETDGPYLLPRDLAAKPASRRNEPCYLPHIARAIAAARREPVENLAEHTTRTARQFFGLSDI